ncbi:MFS sugar transporter [Dipodascopsis tothii]|uniref:MFS sugar transporter n=1 Tax=Dipodascopsis tothii TaxID=44089 RepID=UPI0034CED287
MGKRYLGGSGEALVGWITVATCTVLAFYGYDQGVFGGVIVGDDFLAQFGYPDSHTTATMTSIYNIGCFVGALSTMVTGDKLGRPRALMVGTVWITVGAIVQSCATTRAHMFAGRVVAGLGTGMNTSTAGIYQSETVKSQDRGKLVILQMANCIMGFALSNWMTLGLSYVRGSASWRFPLAFQLVFALVIFAVCPFLPESPRLLIRRGNKTEAMDVLVKLAGRDRSSDDPEIVATYESILAVVRTEQDNPTSWLDLVRGRGPPGMLRRVVLGAGMQAMNQLSGINVTSYYFSYILIHAVGTSEELSRYLAAAGAMDYLLFALMSWHTIERYGRRRVMMVSSAGVCACFVAISALLAMSETGDAQKLGIAAVAFFFLFFAFFGSGCLGVPWLYPTEINATQVRTKATAISTATNWAVNYMCVEITPVGIDRLSWRFWVIWAAISASFVPVTYLFYPETANRTLEDIDLFFAERPPVCVHRLAEATQIARPARYAEWEAERAARTEKGVAQSVWRAASSGSAKAAAHAEHAEC